MEFIASLLLVAGGILLLIAALGVLTLPDALSRQHAATKAGTLALSVVCAGALAASNSLDWAWRLVAIVGFLMATLPVASHLLARAAVREAGLAETLDRLPPAGDRRFE